MFDVAKAAKEADMWALFHSNGSMNEEPRQAQKRQLDGPSTGALRLAQHLEVCDTWAFDGSTFRGKT